MAARYPNSAAGDNVLMPALTGFSMVAILAPIAAEIEAIETQLINSGLAVIHFADRETPAGTIDGDNATFTLAHIPSPAASLQLFATTSEQQSGAASASLLIVDYTLNSHTLTLDTAPGLGDTLTAWYRY